jgi:type IV secretion system protein VirB9
VPAELTFQTNLHRYTFVIQGDAKAKPLFSVTVKYPNHVAKTAYAGFIKTATGKKLNQLYWSSGDTQLQPTAVWDDGYFTYFTFSENTPIPAIYSVYNALGEEQLEESKMVKGGRVLEVRTLARQFTLRLGDEWLAIFNQGYQNR